MAELLKKPFRKVMEDLLYILHFPSFLMNYDLEHLHEVDFNVTYHRYPQQYEITLIQVFYLKDGP